MLCNCHFYTVPHVHHSKRQPCTQEQSRRIPSAAPAATSLHSVSTHLPTPDISYRWHTDGIVHYVPFVFGFFT